MNSNCSLEIDFSIFS